MRFSKRAARMAGDAAAAWAVQDEAAAQFAAGEPMIFLSVGDPDQPTAASVTDLAIDALRAGRTHYSPVPGEPKLRAGVASQLARLTGRVTTPDQVVIFPGAQSALLAVMSMVVGSGDEVIVAEPYYATYPGVIAASGATLVAAPCDSARGFAFDAQSIIDRINPRTRAILFSNPNNPTGAMATHEDLLCLARASREHGVWLIADEVYSNFAYSMPHVSAWPVGDPDWTVVLNSMSKTYAMTGWRLGWATGPADLAVHLGNFAAAAQFGVAQFVQDTVAQVLQRESPEIQALRETYQLRRDTVVRCGESIPNMRVLSPPGGMFVMLDVRKIDSDDVAFCLGLLRTGGVAVIPGSGFGNAARGHVRVSLTQPIEVLERAFAAIERFVIDRYGSK